MPCTSLPSMTRPPLNWAARQRRTDLARTSRANIIDLDGMALNAARQVGRRTAKVGAAQLPKLCAAKLCAAKLCATEPRGARWSLCTGVAYENGSRSPGGALRDA